MKKHVIINVEIHVVNVAFFKYLFYILLCFSFFFPSSTYIFFY